MIVPDVVQKKAASYHLPLMQAFLDRVDVRGKRVMEIGSDYDLVSARLLHANGAKEVVSTNLADWRSPEPLPEGIRFEVVDASATGFADGSFDLIYGIAILEHIPDMEQMCREIRRILKPGGKVFLQGYPFWTCSLGHHVWCTMEGGRAYTYHDSSNPIPHWSHLVLVLEEMEAELQSRGVPREDATRIANFIFNADGKSAGWSSNRQPPSQIVACLSRHFRTNVVWRNRDDTPENKYYSLAAREFGKDDLRTMGFGVLLQ